MSASKILEKLQRKGQITPVAQQQNIKSSQNTAQTSSKSRSSSIASSVTPPGEKVVDPVVARLKAARRAEKEQKERELREKKGLGPKKEPSSRAKISSRASNGSSKQPVRGTGTKPGQTRISNGGRNRAILPTASAPQIQREKKPKMSFSELMAKASGIDQSKMSIAIKQKTRSPEAVSPGPKRKVAGQDPRNVLAARKPVSQSSTQRQTLQQPRNRSAPSSSTAAAAKSQNSVSRPSQPAVQARAPLPMRKPSSALAAKLKQKPSARPSHSGTRTRRENSDENSEEEDEESDDMDSFIASEDEEIEQDEAEYDRDEIWSIFNRGKKRRHFDYDDYDSDDMEATGAEILEEESRSKRNALLEDKREMEKEAKLAALKKARKAGLRR